MPDIAAVTSIRHLHIIHRYHRHLSPVFADTQHCLPLITVIINPTITAVNIVHISIIVAAAVRRRAARCHAVRSVVELAAAIAATRTAATDAVAAGATTPTALNPPVHRSARRCAMRYLALGFRPVRCCAVRCLAVRCRFGLRCRVSHQSAMPSLGAVGPCPCCRATPAPRKPSHHPGLEIASRPAHIHLAPQLSSDGRHHHQPARAFLQVSTIIKPHLRTARHLPVSANSLVQTIGALSTPQGTALAHARIVERREIGGALRAIDRRRLIGTAESS